MPRNQRSVQREGTLRGIALHSGAEVDVRIRPAPADAGVTFVRTDLPGSPRIPADAAHLSTQRRRTAIVGENGAEVHTVEHLLACCTGLRVDNLIVEVSAAELPGMDGSAKPYVELLRSLGIVEQRSPRREIVVDEPVAVAAGEDISLVAFPYDAGFKVSYTLDYAHPFLGVQHVSFTMSEEGFARDIAPARTFVLASEAEALRKAGLGQGASHENTLVVGDKGVIGNTLRWPDEFARHKVLDLLGDLFLAGADLRGHVYAHRTGHAANLRLVERIVDVVKQRETEGRLRRPTGLDLQQIKKILPHRYPMLMIDRVVEIEGFRRAVGVKNVTINEPFFQGHFPGHPIMPGVLIIEAMAQVGGVLLMGGMGDAVADSKVAYFMSLNNVKFRKPVKPGDQLIFEIEIVQIRGAVCKTKGVARVDGEVVCEAEMAAMVRDK